MAESLWADTDASWVEFGWVEGFHESTPEQWFECGWAEIGWVEGDEVCVVPGPSEQWIECGWAEFSPQWISGDEVCSIGEVPSPPKVIGGGGAGFERARSRISLAPQGTRSYKDYGRKDPRKRRNREIIEFVVKFVTEYL